MLIDLHVHTAASRDSNARVEDYLQMALQARSGLDAICLTEHRLYQPRASFESERFFDRYGVRVFNGIEADTDFGHLILLGVTDSIVRSFDLSDRMLKSESLIVALDSEGGLAIPAHPFRDSGFGQRLGYLVEKTSGALRAIEAINGQNRADENAKAVAAAQDLGLIALAGSDAHHPTPDWFLTVATVVDGHFSTLSEVCAEIRTGRARPYDFRGQALP
jgi:predicted metal-dependent phosphoesterase TrpH